MIEYLPPELYDLILNEISYTGLKAARKAFPFYRDFAIRRIVIVDRFRLYLRLNRFFTGTFYLGPLSPNYIDYEPPPPVDNVVTLEQLYFGANVPKKDKDLILVRRLLVANYKTRWYSPGDMHFYKIHFPNLAKEFPDEDSFRTALFLFPDNNLNGYGINSYIHGETFINSPDSASISPS